MSTNYEKLEMEARQLDAKEKAALARTLIEDLDEITEIDVEKLWVDEAQRRYEDLSIRNIASYSWTGSDAKGSPALEMIRFRYLF